MAIMKCRECERDVSSEAKVCPHCGAKKPGWRFNAPRAMVVALVMGLGGWFFFNSYFPALIVTVVVFQFAYRHRKDVGEQFEPFRRRMGGQSW